MVSSAIHSSLHTVQLPQGPIQYKDIGEGPTLLFIHGVNVNGEMWRKVVRPLSTNFRCVVPTLPLGGHALPMNEHADLSPPGIAQVIADFITALKLKEVTAIPCDTGGAFTQLALVHHPDTIERVVFTNCDAFENFLPPILRPLQACFRIPGFASLFGLLARASSVKKLMFGMLSHAPLEPELGEAYFRNFIHNPDIRRDARKVIDLLQKS